ncbi:uncharacterized protein EI90DRAFT_2654701 [Cantharellus anzutake]|uniref:uncharacterized protein n=1 Tax=Cantharellus anzutake TaxID=1750568 RepID=UPI0019041466|nr:uncharacterized protein EI90DRAFT_2654701 [Cantharellus anzutake]KAF8337460.1 hypothetical protein EI90DRAFT_2654701 [Cantharellus anzutake]
MGNKTYNRSVCRRGIFYRCRSDELGERKTYTCGLRASETWKTGRASGHYGSRRPSPRRLRQLVGQASRAKHDFEILERVVLELPAATDKLGGARARNVSHGDFGAEVHIWVLRTTQVLCRPANQGKPLQRPSTVHVKNRKWCILRAMTLLMSGR